MLNTAVASAASATRRSMSTANGYLRSAVGWMDTMHFQSSLPRMPIPKLNESLDRYLRSAQAVVPPTEFENTKKAVAEFRAGVGQRLQFELEDWDRRHSGTSYISGPWFDMYLKNRAALPLNLTPQLTWKDDPEPAKMEQATRAANILAATARFYFSLRAGVLQPDLFVTKSMYNAPWFQTFMEMSPKRAAFYVAAAAGAYALDMSQYHNLFSSTRIPKKGKDVLVRADHDEEYVIVQRNHEFYKVKIFDHKKGAPLTEVEIEAQIRAILNRPVDFSAAPVSVLTAINRDDWAEVRPALEALNPQALKDIDRALFTLTLDDAAPTSHTDICRTMLHGSGRDRWFDKSFNIMVCQNGKAGVAWEHSWGDGVAMLRVFEEIYKEISAEPARPAAQPAAGVDRINFFLNANLESAIAKAKAATDAFIASADIAVAETDILTKADLKRASLSPDGTMQMVMQLAHWRMHGYVPATYESASTAAFKHGRTETIRSATLEAAAFVKAFSDPNVDAVSRVKVLRDAVGYHSKLTREALTGKGFDRHLFGLRIFAEQMNVPTPSIFTDKGYQIMSDIRLSTSTLSSPALQNGGFGPISPRAYSCGYGIEDFGCRFMVMTNKLGTADFAQHLSDAAGEVRQALDNGQPFVKPRGTPAK